MFSSHSVLKFDLYHMEIKDRIYSVRLHNGNTTYRNVLKYRNTGAELSYEWNVPSGFPLDLACLIVIQNKLRR